MWLPGLLVAAVGAFGFLHILDAVLEQDDFVTWDEPMIEWLADHRTAWLTATMTAITNVFGPIVLPILIAVGAGIWVWRTRSWRDPVLLVGAMIFSTVMTSVTKNVVGRARPSEEIQAVPGVEHSFSFPSGHTTGAATLVFVTGYLLWRHSRSRLALVLWAVASVLITGLVAFTRMYLGYHFLSDVLAGACVGLFTLGLVMCVDRCLDLRRVSPAESGVAAQSASTSNSTPPPTA
ncbi:phosphatase PAP2 family protein [Demequina sediminicola]|uniref:phosphatase PAP2 family protein n=1 Tax=Demequina sediminicola TaxID=1095026 RepID=UPI0007852A9B|nr:phosphatase PAP2 family protein [Demequina sediminicola]